MIPDQRDEKVGFILSESLVLFFVLKLTIPANPNSAWDAFYSTKGPRP